MESDAVLLIMDAIQKGLYVLKSSPVHFVETGAIQDERERVDIEAFLSLYGQTIICDLRLAREKAENFSKRGIGIADSAHLAFAQVGADVIISCDDKFVKKARNLNLECEVVTPLEFCEKEQIR